MAALSVLCLSCGTSNPSDRVRCAGCGAKVASLGDDTRSSTPRSPFAFSWLGVGLVGYSTVLAVLIVALPFVIGKYDPQGLSGILISMGVWMVGGYVIGAAAKDSRVLEPSVAAALTAAAIIPYIAAHSDVRALDTGTYVAGGVLGVLAAFLGAFLGDRTTAGRASR